MGVFYRLLKKPFVLFIIWSLWLSAEFLLGTYSHVRIHDAGDSLLPQLLGSKIQFFKFGPSYFSDFSVSGIDASLQSLVPFSNFNSLIFTIFPGWVAYGLLMFIQRFIASYFTFRLCRDILRIGFFPSLVSGLLFSLYNFSIFSFTVYHQLGLPALPLILWFLEKMFKGKGNKKLVYISFAGVLFGYSNYFAYFVPYFLPFIFLWLFWFRKINLRQIPLFLLFSLFLLLPQTPSLVSILLNSESSHRVFWFPGRVSLGLFETITYIAYNFLNLLKSYAIHIVLILILVFCSNTKKIRKVLFMTIVLMAAPTIGYLLQKLFLKYSPVIKSFSIDRFEILVPFLFAISIAVLFHYANFKKNKKIIFTLMVIILVSASIKIKIDTIFNYAPYRNLYEHPDLENLSKNTDSSKWRVVTITGAGLRSSYSLAYGLSNVDGYLTLYPKGYHSFWKGVISKRIANDPLRYDDFVNWGNRIYLYGPKEFYNSEAINFEQYYDLDLLSLANVKYMISAKPVNSKFLTLLPSVYREKFVKWSRLSMVQKTKLFLTGEYFGVPIYIYENSQVLPRFFTLSSGSIDADTVKVLNYLPDKVELEVNSKEDTILVISINFYPYWQATVNGRPEPIEMYRDTFMYLKIRQGTENVILEYKPPYKIQYRGLLAL